MWDFKSIIFEHFSKTSTKDVHRFALGVIRGELLERERERREREFHSIWRGKH